MVEPAGGPQGSPASLSRRDATYVSNTVLQRCAPQVRPNTLASSPAAVLPPGHVSSKQTPTSETCLASQARAKRKYSQFFPLSAFLACPDPTGRYPSTSKFLNSAAVGSASSEASFGRGKCRTPDAVISRNCVSPLPTPESSTLSCLSQDSNLHLGSSTTHTPMHWLLRSSTQSRPINYRAEPTAGATGCGQKSTALITAPIGSPRPLINMPPVRTGSAVPVQFSRPKMILSMSSRPRLVLHAAKSELQHDAPNFLDLGHANPCWCRTHVDSVALERNKGATVEGIPAPLAHMNAAVDSTFTTRSKSPLETASLSSSLRVLRPLSHMSSVLSDDWTMLPDNSHDRGRRSRSISSYESSEDDEGTFIISPTSYANTRPPTPMPSPEDGRSESHSGSSSTSLCDLSSSGSSVECIRSPWFEEECQVCHRYICVCDSASTSAVEWPVPQYDAGVTRTRRELCAGYLSDEDTEGIWELEWNWFL